MDNVLRLTAQIISAHISSNDVSVSQLPALIRAVHEALATIGQTVAEPSKAEPAVSAMKSVFPDHIVCLDCGKSLTSLKRHLFVNHGTTPDEYRAKWGLPPTYPMVAAEYAAQRSKIAKDSGLGRKVAQPPKKRGRPAKG
jgi:predicted transcriptional regulator